MLRTAAAAFLAVAACAAATAPTGPADREHAPLGDEDICDAAAASALIGLPASDENAARALELSGARMIKWIRAGEPVTFEYMTSRLIIDVDRGGRIAGFRCG
jgi:hypothetical protein